MKTTYQSVAVDGVDVFYREAGKDNKKSILLLHGFPTSSHMFRSLMAKLADDYHVVAPDLPGFGFTVPPRDSFKYTYDHLADVILGFVKKIGLKDMAVYVFDYGAPVGFRMALKEPGLFKAFISQNGNIYQEGVGPMLLPIVNATPEKRGELGGLASLDFIKENYYTGADKELVSPDGMHLDYYYISRPGIGDIQIDLVLEYKTNVELYPQFQAYLRDNKVPVLAVWGKNDQFFLPPGAEAYKRDSPDCEVHFVDSGHFALETHCDEICAHMRTFLEERL